MDVVGFEELYRRYARDLYRFTLHLAGDPTWAEDIVSETFIRCWTSPEPIRVATVKSYLFTIARNLYLRELMRRARQTELKASEPDGSSLERWAEGRERLSSVLDALQRLPEVDRSAVLMRANDLLSYEEIASALGLSLGAVKVKVHRARYKLAALFHEEKPI